MNELQTDDFQENKTWSWNTENMQLMEMITFNPFETGNPKTELANGEDPDHTLHNMVSDQCLHCLQSKQPFLLYKISKNNITWHP